jgi:hypothetical protein
VDARVTGACVSRHDVGPDWRLGGLANDKTIKGYTVQRLSKFKWALHFSSLKLGISWVREQPLLPMWGKSGGVCPVDSGCTLCSQNLQWYTSN